MSQILGSNSYIKITTSVFDYNAAYTVLLHYRVDTAPTGDYATVISISNDGEAALIGMITGGDNPPDEIEIDDEHQRKI